jgi:hypothetical protein
VRVVDVCTLPSPFPLPKGSGSRTRGLRVDAGGLISSGQAPDISYHRAATYVDKILKGTKPADLPVEPRQNSS